VHPDLESLLRLQQADEDTTRTQEAIDALGTEEQVLDAALEGAERAWQAGLEATADAARQREALEGRIENYRQMQERRRQQLEFVRGAKEASALMAELDLARSVMAREEAEWLRSSDSVSEAERRAAEAEAAISALKDEQTPLRASLAERRSALEGAHAEALRIREQIAKEVRQELRARYERILNGRAPRALYALHGEACGNCFTAVPLNRRAQIERGHAIESCEVCGVLLYMEQ
jgi:predicted  nucleic acid-binding Zn-ribbon protein